MYYLNLPNRQSASNSRLNILYRDNQLWFQRITQIEADKFLFINVPLDNNFTGAVRNALFPDKPNTYVPNDNSSCGEKAMAENHIIDASNNPKMDPLPEKEALVNLWIQDDGCLEVMIYLGEEDGINYLFDKETLKEVLKFINGVIENLKEQIVLVEGTVVDNTPCEDHVADNPFECCRKCPECHCGPTL